MGDSPAQLLSILTELQKWNYLPEVHILEPGADLEPVVRDALDSGIRNFVVSGGDGTIDTVAALLHGARATLGIIPTGTQNNVAFSLGIPSDIPSAAAIMRTGRRIKTDLGLASFGERVQPFLEVCSVGLLSALFPAADDIQHGNLARIGDLLATLVAFPPAEIHLLMDRRTEVTTQGHVVLVGNMPYAGPHYQIAPEESYNDGYLDVLLFANISKLELIGQAVQLASGILEDPRIQRYRVRNVRITTNPPMPVLADGFPIGDGAVNISVRKHVLPIMIGGEGSGG